MELNLMHLSPLDGRYATQCEKLRPFMSEFGLIRFRLLIEIEWLLTLAKHPKIIECRELSQEAESFIRNIFHNFSESEALNIKQIEKITQHDVKALEYYLQEKFQDHPECKALVSFIHFGCTSEDINNLAYALMMQEGRKLVLQDLEQIHEKIYNFALENKALPLLSLTHGQPASPSTIGKEFMNVYVRLKRQITQLKKQPILGKMNGAVGNFNAVVLAYPEVNWLEISQKFVENLQLEWNLCTTQIEPHDALAELFHNLSRTNTILIDFVRDIWGYIARGVFTQHVEAGEIGSSTMPHKVNPIHFENAEGNFGVANALLDFLAQKLPCSRFQRDLSDSTVLRNLGSVFGYCIISYHSLLKGLNKLLPNKDVLGKELDNAWEVLAEPIQTIMRKYGCAHAYEMLKDLTRNKYINAKTLLHFISQMDIPQTAKQQLTGLTPHTYLGLASHIVDYIKENET